MKQKLVVAVLRMLSVVRAAVLRVVPLRLRAVKALIRRADGRVLLVRHSYGSGLWMLPGGLARRGEDAVAAVRREADEELGIDPGAQWMLVAEYRHRIGLTRQRLGLYSVTIEDDPRPNVEIAEALFVDPSDPPEGTSPATLRRLREIASGAVGDGEW